MTEHEPQAVPDGSFDGVQAQAQAHGAASDPAPASDPALASDPDPVSDSAAATLPKRGSTDASLLALVDRLAAVLEGSDLVELEVEAGGTGLVLRRAEAIAITVPAGGPGAAPAGPADGGPPVTGGGPAGEAAAHAAPIGRPSVKAPLTGIWYAAPSPGSAPFVTVGQEVVAGQVIGLIEAMKLFNEIKSDLSGRVVRVAAENGQLVKAKQPLLEVEPL